MIIKTASNGLNLPTTFKGTLTPSPGPRRSSQASFQTSAHPAKNVNHPQNYTWKLQVLTVFIKSGLGFLLRRRKPKPVSWHRHTYYSKAIYIFAYKILHKSHLLLIKLQQGRVLVQQKIPLLTKNISVRPKRLCR